MGLFYRTCSWSIPSRQHCCLVWDSLLIIQSFRASSPGATIHLRGQQVKAKMSGVVTPSLLKAATRQDKHLQTSLIKSQRVFDVAERVDGNIFGTEMKLGRRRGCFSDLSGQLQNQNTTTKTFTSQMLLLKTTLKQPHSRSVIHCDTTASLVLLAAPYLKDSYSSYMTLFPIFPCPVTKHHSQMLRLSVWVF